MLAVVNMSLAVPVRTPVPMNVTSRSNFDALALESSAHRPATRRDPRSAPRGACAKSALPAWKAEFAKKVPSTIEPGKQSLPKQANCMLSVATTVKPKVCSESPLILDAPPSSSLFNSLGLIDCQPKAATKKKKVPQAKTARCEKTSANKEIGQKLFIRAPGPRPAPVNTCPTSTRAAEEAKASPLLDSDRATDGDILAHHIRELLRHRSGHVSSTMCSISHHNTFKKVANSNLSTAAPTRDHLPDVEVPRGRLVSPSEDSVASSDDVKLFREAPVLLAPAAIFPHYDF